MVKSLTVIPDMSNGVSQTASSPVSRYESTERHDLAVWIALFGYFLKIVLSAPILESLGVGYAGTEGGNPLTKIHIGTYFIFLALIVLLLDHKEPLRQMMRTYKQHTIYCLLFLLYIFLSLYWILRNPVGVGLLIDTHMTIPLAAILFSYASLKTCRLVVHGFVAIGIINGLAGIVESIGQFRILTFDPSWAVLAEAQFRASAFLGHPLDNAIYTALVLVTAMAMKYKPAWKFLFVCILLPALVAFGGRAALGVACLSLIPTAYVALRASTRRMTMMKIFGLTLAILVIPVLIIGGLFVVLNTQMGARLMAFSHFNDNSAAARLIVVHVFDYMQPHEILFGVSTERVKNIAESLGLMLPLSDVENPWLLMFLLLGALMFPVWLAMTAAFIWKVTKDQPFQLKMVAAAYFLIASTSNSFGRKDTMYAVMIAVVTCAGRVLADAAAVSAVKKRTRTPPMAGMQITTTKQLSLPKN